MMSLTNAVRNLGIRLAVHLRACAAVPSGCRDVLTRTEQGHCLL